MSVTHVTDNSVTINRFAHYILATMKRCTKCGEEKPFEAFYSHLDRGVRRQRSACKECWSKLPSRSAKSRREEKRKGYAKRGRVYVPRPRGEAGRQLHLERKLERSLTSPRFYTEMRRWWHPATPKAFAYRLRYNTDPEFRTREIARTWARRAASGVLRTDGRSTRRISEDGTLTAEVIARLFAAATECPYCGRQLTPRTKTLDHRTPTARGGMHSIHNVLVCCGSCNKRKHTTPYEAWLARLGKSQCA